MPSDGGMERRVSSRDCISIFQFLNSTPNQIRQESNQWKIMLHDVLLSIRFFLDGKPQKAGYITHHVQAGIGNTRNGNSQGKKEWLKGAERKKKWTADRERERVRHSSKERIRRTTRPTDRPEWMKSRKALHLPIFRSRKIDLPAEVGSGCCLFTAGISVCDTLSPPPFRRGGARRARHIRHIGIPIRLYTYSLTKSLQRYDAEPNDQSFISKNSMEAVVGR